MRNSSNALYKNIFPVLVIKLTSSLTLNFSEDAMIENFEGAYDELTREIADYRTPECVPVPADRWIVSSLLQKAIRRGEAPLAERAALSFLKAQSTGLFRRLMVIACEDVGAADPDAVVKTLLAAEFPQWRERSGGNARVAAYLARMLAEAPKDRSADYLICAARSYPTLDSMREIVGSRPLSERLALVEAGHLSLLECAVAAWYASGIEWGAEKRVGLGDMPGLLDTFRRLGVASVLAHACGYAAERTRQPICLMVPLLALAVNVDAGRRVEEHPVPASFEVNGVPMWCLDQFTHTGKRAIQTFARENSAVRTCLEEYVPEYRHGSAACTAVFYAEGCLVSHRLNWSHSNALAAVGIRNDLLASGVPSEDMGALMAAVRDNLDHLNAIRARLFAASRRFAEGGPNQPQLL